MRNENLKHHRDWDCDGAIRMENAQTTKLYDQIQQETYNVKLEEFECFYAFDNKQFVAKDKSWWGMSATYKDGKLCQWHKD